MEYMKENMKLGISREWDKLRIKIEEHIKVVKSNIRNHRFITAVGILFLIFSAINIMLISYFVQIMKMF